MNAKQLIATVAALTIAGTAFAQQAEVTNVQSGKTRAQVIAELQQAQANGTAETYSFVGTQNPVAAAGSAKHVQGENQIPTGKTRAEVVATLSDNSATPSGFVAFDAPAAVTTKTTRTAVAQK